MNISNINNYDIMFLSNKEIFKEKEKQDLYQNIDYDVNELIKYKKKIKSKMDKLLDEYLDISNSSILPSNVNNNTIKYKTHFHYFILNLIKSIKLNEKKNTIQNELKEYTNKNNLLDYDFINVDASYIEFTNTKPKKSTLDNFVKKINIESNIILPKKR